MTNNEGINNNTLKTVNRGIVLKLLATNRYVSRIELATKSGLSKMSVSNIISEFLEKGIVEETECADVKYVTRAPIMMTLSPSAPKIVGVLIHRHYVSAVLCDFHLNILDHDTETHGEISEEELIQMAFRLTAKMLKHGNVLGIGIGSIGPVDIERGMILNPPEFYGIKNLPIVRYFEQEFELPVFLDHHYNCAAIAEKYYGSGKEYSNYFFLGIDDGIGLGIVVNNDLFSNMTGFASELGHLSINWNGMQCDCGNKGCLGDYVEFERAYTRNLGGLPICDEKIFTQMIDYLIVAMTGLVNILNPQAIIIGDEKGYFKKRHYQYLEREINIRIQLNGYRYVNVLHSLKEENARAAACAMRVITQTFTGRLTF